MLHSDVDERSVVRASRDGVNPKEERMLMERYRNPEAICLVLLLACTCALSFGATVASAQEALIAGHTCTDLDQVPDCWIERAKLEFMSTYGHTSHGSQIVTGMNLVYGDGATNNDSPSCNGYGCTSCLYSFCDDYYYYRYGTGNDPAPPGTLSFFDQRMAGDLGHNGDLTWANTTRTHLDGYGGSRNLVIWSWCGGVSDNTEEGINIYLNAMNQLEIDYPGVTFIYMTGHLDGTGETGDLHIFNNQIRDYCVANGKVLFDFADIESYDPDGDYFLDLGATDTCNYSGGNWAVEWCAENPESELCDACTECSHSHCLNCNLKGRAFWWMLARLAGWSGAADGDGDCDLDVDLDDYLLFVDCLAGPDTLPAPTLTDEKTCRTVFDFDGDTDVDLADFTAFQDGFGG